MATSAADTLLDAQREIISSGVWKQDSPYSIPLWSDGYNIRFTKTGVRKMYGWSSIFTELDTKPVRGMHQFRDSSKVQWLYWGDYLSLYSWNTASVVQEKTSLSGNQNQSTTHKASVWSIENYGDYVFATNGVDGPYKDVGSGFVSLSADFTTCEIFLRKGPHLLAFNTSVNNRQIAWCDTDDPETWTPTSSNAAGDVILREMEGEIIAAVPIGDRIAVYGQSQMFLVSYVGQPFYFGYVPAQEGFGAISKQSVISVGRKNYGFGRQGIWVTDGVSHNFIDTPAVHDFLQGDVSWSQASKVCGWHDEDYHMLVWYYPSTSGSGEPDKGIAFDYENGIWIPYNFGRTSAIPRDVYDYPVAATDGGQVFYHNFGSNADGAALSSSLTSKLLDLGDPSLIKTITDLRIEWSGTGLLYALGSSTDTDTTATYDTAAAVSNGFSKIDSRKTARYFSIRFSSTATGDDWELNRFTFFGKKRGGR